MTKWAVTLEDTSSRLEIKVEIDYDLPNNEWNPETTNVARDLAVAKLHVVEIDRV